MNSQTQFRGAALAFTIAAILASCSSSAAKTSVTVKAPTTSTAVSGTEPSPSTTPATTTVASAPPAAGSTVTSVAPTLVESTSPPPTSTVSGSSTNTFKVAVSGAVTGQLQPDGTGFITCYGDGAAKDPGFEAGFSSTLSGKVYTLGLRFGAFSTAPVAFPPSKPFANGQTVTVQFSADADPTTKWVMAQGFGSGTITLAGGNGQPVTGSIDGDLAKISSGQNVHITATFACTPAS